MRVTWEEPGWERPGSAGGPVPASGLGLHGGAVVGEGAALLIDAGSSLAEGARLRPEARRSPAGGRVTYLALTHPHFDHVFGAAAFAGVEVFGAVGLDAVFGTDATQLAGGRRTQRSRPRRGGRGGGRCWSPRSTAFRRVDARTGRRRQVLLANVGPGHTGHDLVVLVPRRRAAARRSVFCGDLVEESGEPQAGPDAVPSRWPAALDRLLALGRRGRAVRTRPRRGGGRGVRPGPTGRAGGAFRRVVMTVGRTAAASPIVIRMRQYSPDLTPPWKKPKPVPEVPADPGLVVEEPGTGFCGAVIRCEAGDGHAGGPLRQAPGVPAGAARLPAGGQGGDAGAPVVLALPVRPTRTASGSVAVPGARARVARAGRIYVEGRHDAELVEKVWGDDLRIEGVVVEYLEGVDDLPVDRRRSSPRARTRAWACWWTTWSRARRSRASRESVTSEHALVVGHPYIDIWEAVKPSSVGIPAWPRVPRGQDWKTGVCRALGWPENTGAAWQRDPRRGCAPTGTWSRSCWAGWRN